MKSKLSSLIPFIIIAVFMILVESSPCRSFGNLVILIGLGIMYLIVLLILLTIGVISHKGFRGVNYFPLIFTCCFVFFMAGKISYRAMIYDSSNDILVAHRQINSKKAKFCTIELMSNNRYKITKVVNVELRCRYYGKYKIENDSILFDAGIQKVKGDCIAGNTLMIDKKKKVLKPTDKPNDSTYWFNLDKP